MHVLAVGPKFERAGLRAFHTPIIVWLMEDRRGLRTGRHVVFGLHVHLVFLTRYRCGVLDDDAIERLRGMFAKVCADFEAELIELEGQDDHVHLLVEYLPKVAVSALVNSLKGVSSRLLRKVSSDNYFGRPARIIDVRQARSGPIWNRGIGRVRSGRHPISPPPAVARRSISCASTSSTSVRRTEPNHGYAVRAILPRPERRGLPRTGSDGEGSESRLRQSRDHAAGVR